jgi:hypothetical protein
MDQWKVRVRDANKDISDIIKAIQDAQPDEKIGAILARSKNIYLGKFTYEDIEYPVAIYGNGTDTKIEDALTKIQVSDANVLEDKDSINHIYCDETPIDYMIIGFYEEGKDDPTLIMQIEKFDISKWQFTKEKWLEYLGILKVDTNNIFELKEDDKIIDQNEYVTISAVPEMPNLKVKNISDKEVQFRLKIEYRRDIRADEDFFPEKEWETVKAGETWDIDFGDKIRGGRATLQYKEGEETKEYVFHIRGINPTEQAVKNYINEQNYDVWFLTRLIRQESNFRQFNNGTNYGPEWSDYVGCPNHGSPHGWGLMQLDLLGGTSANPLRPTVQELWDWKANLRRGVEFIEGEKYNSVDRHFEREMEDIDAWNYKNPDNKIEGHANQIEGNITYTHSNSDNFDYDFGDAPTGNNHSFIDATWIKNYNGSSEGTDGYPGYYYVLKQVGNNKPYWDLHRTNSNNHNYVEAVSNRIP